VLGDQNDNGRLRFCKTMLTDVQFMHKITRNMIMADFWVVAPSRLVRVYQCFRDLYCFHHQGDVHSEHHPDARGSTDL
jgi:hypothetical protein